MRQKALQKWCNYTDWVLHILRAFTNVTLVSEDNFWRLYLASEGNVHDDYHGHDGQDDQDQIIKQYLVIKSYLLISSDLINCYLVKMSDSLYDVLPVAMFYYLTTKSCQLS